MMTLKEIYQKILESGPARAYFSKKGQGSDTWYHGQRGDLKIEEGGFIYFSADCGQDKDEKFYLGSPSEVHAPSIGHYNF